MRGVCALGLIYYVFLHCECALTAHMTAKISGTQFSRHLFATNYEYLIVLVFISGHLAPDFFLLQVLNTNITNPLIDIYCIECGKFIRLM